MSLPHIINTGVPGVLFCHTFIMHAMLMLCAGSFISYAYALPLQWVQAFLLFSVLRLRLGAVHWRKQWLIIKFKVIICITIDKSPALMYLRNNGNPFATAANIMFNLVCCLVWWVVGYDSAEYIIRTGASLVSTLSILVSIIKHSICLKQILIKCVHWCSFQSVLFSLFVGYVIQC